MTRNHISENRVIFRHIEFDSVCRVLLLKIGDQPSDIHNDLRSW